MIKRLIPTGVCWCGCGQELEKLGSFFAQGHDKVAESRVIREVFGSVPHFLVAFGYAPNDAGRVAPGLYQFASDARMKASLLRLVEVRETMGAIANEALVLLDTPVSA